MMSASSSRKKQHDEDEGFAEGQRDNQQQQQNEEPEGKSKKVEKIDEKFIQEFVSYGNEESILSELFKMRVSQFDVLLLFFEILKLEIKGREQERLARQQEREMQLLHMQSLVENFKSQGNMLLMTSIGSGVLAIISGICPIVGYTKAGNFIQQKLGNLPFLAGIKDMKKDQFFKAASKMLFTMSETYKSTGQIHQSFAEGNRTYDQHMSDLHSKNWDENVRTMEEIKDSWKGIENFLYQALQMYHETIRQLYGH